MTAFCALTLVPAAPAAAHATLKRISPRHGSVQTSMPTVVELTFDQPVSRRFTVVKVTGSAKAQAASGAPAVDGAVVRQPLRPLSRPGRYQVAYRTVSVDGHVISGSRQFVFKPPAGGTPPAAPAAPAGTSVSTPAASDPGPAPAASDRRSEEASGPSWALVALGGVAVALTAAIVMAVRRGRHDG